MPSHADESAELVERLTTMGLPPRPTGWVPEQPGELSAPPAVAAAPLPSRMDGARFTLADWLPRSLGDRVRAMSSSSFTSALVAVAAIAIAVGIYVHDHRPSSGYADDYSTSAEADPAPTSASSDFSDGSSIVVDVSGAVRHPGLVTLPVGARVDDAIKAAGGPLHPRELAHTNLAARVADGQLLVVGAKKNGDDGESKLVSLSTASLTKLETLPGVGPVTAQKIVDWRKAHGGFSSVEQLQQVSGIGPAKYAEISPLVSP